MLDNHNFNWYFMSSTPTVLSVFCSVNSIKEMPMTTWKSSLSLFTIFNNQIPYILYRLVTNSGGEELTSVVNSLPLSFD